MGVHGMDERADGDRERDGEEDSRASQRAGVVAEGEPDIHPERAVTPCRARRAAKAA